ncbi:MAG: hypothetical protein QM778_07770 [Myxococcales bacterium]
MSSLPPIAGGTIEVSSARWPLIKVRFVGQADDVTVDNYLEELSRAISRPGRRTLLMDATECGYVSSYARRRQAEWMRQQEPTIRRETVGIAFALTAPLVRGALTAILWLEPLSCPYAVVRDEAAALSRCRAWLEPYGLAIPERTRVPA